MIAKIFYDKQPVHFADEDFHVYRTHFMKYGVSPMQFLRIMNICERRTFSAGQVIHRQGSTVTGLTIVRTGECTVHVDKEPAAEIVGGEPGVSILGPVAGLRFIQRDVVAKDVPEVAAAVAAATREAPDPRAAASDAEVGSALAKLHELLIAPIADKLGTEG